MTMEVKTKSVRSELKENVLAHYLENLIKWSMNNLPIILGGLGVVVIVILAGSVFFLKRQEAKNLNWTRMAQAQALVRQGDLTNSQSIFNEIKTKSPNTTEALFAAYFLGDIALSEKKFDQAITLFSDVVQEAGSLAIKPLALSNLAFSFEEKKDFAMAANTYKQFMNSYAEHFLAPRVQLSWGRALLKSGETEAAKETLGQLVDLYPTSPWAENARQTLDKLALH